MTRQVEMDGVEEVRKDEFHSWTCKVREGTRYSPKHKPAKSIHIPLAVAEYLNLKKNDFVQVAIRKLPEREVDE